MRHLMHRHSRSLHAAETLVSVFIDLLARGLALPLLERVWSDLGR